MKVGGHIAVIGVLSGTDASLSIFSILAKQVRIEGLIVGSRQDQIDYVKALELMAQKPVIDKVFSYERLGEAFAHLQSGQHVGKVCVSW